ncbi:uncharacterized protein BJ212DRAFT_1475455 [Suillus subaureus]|uniref:Uncharacterized protein n=1 Tax=Suillus subaureus TaxID=48587 RepID=A0A9P7EP00_9AGAM|nr:uncharacterized protein BJ212DRAFT_1475455 [Suillus subaureus]KAG1826117.1 hypothetical protein BJ212DRAFT_1475455 [Suillus subaureus]
MIYAMLHVNSSLSIERKSATPGIYIIVWVRGDNEIAIGLDKEDAEHMAHRTLLPDLKRCSFLGVRETRYAYTNAILLYSGYCDA